MISLIGLSTLHAEDFYWKGTSTNINAASSWVGNNKPDFTGSAAENDVWNFNVTGSSPNISSPNIRLAGFYFQPNSGAFNISGNSPLDVYGFTVGSTTYAIYNNTANTQTFSTNGAVKFHGSALTFETGTGKLLFSASTDFTQVQQMVFTGQGNTEFTGNVNVNSVRWQFSNSGVNDVRVAFNSAEELIIDGGSTTTFHQNTSVNNSGTLVTNFSVAHFNSTFNSNKLTVDYGAKVYIGGNASHNGGIDLKCGTLLLKSSNVIGNHNLNAMGGIFNLQGFSEGLNNLSLSVNSMVDFGSGAGANSLNFQGAGAFASGKMLTVMNWTSGDSFQVLNISNSKAQQVRFYGDYGVQGVGFYQAQLNGNTLTPGNFLYATAPDMINCVPVPVPEPSTYIMGGALMIALTCFEWRRRRAQKSSPNVGA
ncbi:hypothetical protein [Cerasicoccus arenae]|uniref:PEP-CTERM sorting domain-containing protein n=1 Tax=Cerasicoccus arenae TaxID=424488 RepID=A0A8J3DD24_9BACT|nr:hypothetical protein [Cerasicoccus arenae]MBK1858554.1 hypothetical protein [Cerasicoccus arenae]GHC06262.1 hypothetical protein GCM10007047_24200 [Cerasicoccus arenae]